VEIAFTDSVWKSSLPIVLLLLLLLLVLLLENCFWFTNAIVLQLAKASSRPQDPRLAMR